MKGLHCAFGARNYKQKAIRGRNWANCRSFSLLEAARPNGGARPKKGQRAVLNYTGATKRRGETKLAACATKKSARPKNSPKRSNSLKFTPIFKGMPPPRFV